jgi:drug/metabolite transporter (DMT)-like permease
MHSVRARAIAVGIISSLFFSLTFIINRRMSFSGGNWIWSAALRFYWMLPFFAIIIAIRRNFLGLFNELKRNLVQWLTWSTIGFGIFYASLTYAAAYAPSWLVASTWQFTIIAGLIISPFINPSKAKKDTGIFRSFLFSAIILLGIIIAQMSHAQSFSIKAVATGILPVLVAAFAYPLGNRKLMQITNGRLDVYQRILGMLLCSMPFWILLSIYELLVNRSRPENSQYAQTFIVAITSGLIATALFFSATDKVRTNPQSLAAVEATQSAQVIFAMLGEIWLLNSPLPSVYAFIGVILVLAGMILHSLNSA